MSKSPAVIVQSGTPGGLLSPDEYTEAFTFLYDEWMAADSFLESLGIPAQGEEGGDLTDYTMAQRIRMALDEKRI